MNNNVVYMLDLKQIITILQDRNLSEVCRRTGLNYITVWRISNEGKITNPNYETVKKLSDYLEKKPGD
jgi:DNA invertase Pin-like site-specific DNA recombinase